LPVEVNIREKKEDIELLEENEVVAVSHSRGRPRQLWWERPLRNRDVVLLQRARAMNQTHVTLNQDGRLDMDSSLSQPVHAQAVLDALFQVKKRCIFMHGSGQKPSEVRPISSTFKDYWGKVEGVLSCPLLFFRTEYALV
jgi:hypothetical protein